MSRSEPDFDESPPMDFYAPPVEPEGDGPPLALDIEPPPLEPLSEVDRAVRDFIADTARESRTGAETFDPSVLRRLVAEAEARARARTPAERAAFEERKRRTRVAAARYLAGPVAPAFVVDLLLRHGPRIFVDERGKFLRLITSRHALDERGPALVALADHLLARRVSARVVAVLLAAWATDYLAPVPHEHEILDAIRAALGRRRAARA